MHHFSATLKIVGVNPYVELPESVLNALLRDAGKETGPIPIHGQVNDVSFTQTLVKFQGEWRLYINMKMLKNSPQRIGETVRISVAVDPHPRIVPMHPKLEEALAAHPKAKEIFESLTPSLQKEIKRYIDRLQSEESVERNVDRAIGFLLGRNRFVGRAPSHKK